MMATMEISPSTMTKTTKQDEDPTVATLNEYESEATEANEATEATDEAGATDEAEATDEADQADRPENCSFSSVLNAFESTGNQRTKQRIWPLLVTFVIILTTNVNADLVCQTCHKPSPKHYLFDCKEYVLSFILLFYQYNNFSKTLFKSNNLKKKYFTELLVLT
jgi:hypothetical protein